MSVNPWDAIPADDELKSRVWDSVPADIDVKPWDSVAADADMKPWGPGAARLRRRRRSESHR